MSECIHLSNAPITEALIDIRVAAPDGADIGSLAAFGEAIRENYPERRERVRWHGHLTFSLKESPTLDTESRAPDGYLFTSKDGRQVVQGRLDGFTFSRLKPYLKWEELRDNARALWNEYCLAAKPESVTRVSVRYNNHLEFPIPFDDLSEWIETLPKIAPDLPQTMDGFFLRLHLPFETPEGFVNLTQKIEPGEYHTHIPLLLDIDAFLPVNLKPGDGMIWEHLEQLREIKNRVFFGSITPKTVELYR